MERKDDLTEPEKVELKDVETGERIKETPVEAPAEPANQSEAAAAETPVKEVPAEPAPVKEPEKKAEKKKAKEAKVAKEPAEPVETEETIEEEVDETKRFDKIYSNVASNRFENLRTSYIENKAKELRKKRK